MTFHTKSVNALEPFENLQNDYIMHLTYEYEGF